MSSSVKIRVKVGVGEVEIESPADSLDKVIDRIPSLLDRISSTLASIPSISNNIMSYPQPSSDASIHDTYNENTLPDIRIDKGDSLSDIILKMFKTPWGRSARRLSDVKRALEHYGLSYPKQSVAVTLLRLAQHGKLRRFKGQDNEFVYTASTELLTETINDSNSRREEVMGAL